ncbi:MAG: hypothetical protein RJQ07_10495 [Pseudomonadales bacterium]
MIRTALILSVTVLLAQPGMAASEALPRTSWGDPDLSGLWSNETLTPFERREGDPEFISPEAADAARKRIEALRHRTVPQEKK